MYVSLFIASCISLFSLINPLSALPVFISLTSNHSTNWRNSQIRKTALYIVLICLVSFYAGTYILSFFGVSIHALKMAGGIVIARSGFMLLNAQHKGDVKGRIKEESLNKEDISFSPLAMPLLAGPGSISLLINMSIEARYWEQKAVIVLAIITVALAIFILFTVAPKVIKYIGETGLKSISKIMGFLVLAIGIQMITDSIIHLFKIPI
ncbi:MAG: hypothetical protein RLZ10_353 [Bacteroidota bacterium]|jgi:multiple antibiotic resistance protein